MNPLVFYHFWWDRASQPARPDTECPYSYDKVPLRTDLLVNTIIVLLWGVLTDTDWSALVVNLFILFSDISHPHPHPTTVNSILIFLFCSFIVLNQSLLSPGVTLDWYCQRYAISIMPCCHKILVVVERGTQVSSWPAGKCWWRECSKYLRAVSSVLGGRMGDGREEPQCSKYQTSVSITKDNALSVFCHHTFTQSDHTISSETIRRKLAFYLKHSSYDLINYKHLHLTTSVLAHRMYF